MTGSRSEFRILNVRPGSTGQYYELGDGPEKVTVKKRRDDSTGAAWSCLSCKSASCDHCRWLAGETSGFAPRKHWKQALKERHTAIDNEGWEVNSSARHDPWPNPPWEQ